LVNWYLAYMCIFALATGVVGTVDHKNAWGKATAIWVMGFFGYFLLFQGLVATMYVDPLQGLLLLVCFVVAPQVWHGARPLLAILPMLIFLVLIKHVGIVFACMAIGLCVVMSYAETGRLRARDFKRAGALLAVCLLYFLSWKLYTMAYGLEPAYHLDVGKLSADEGMWGVLSGAVWGVLHNRFPHTHFFGLSFADQELGIRYLWHAMAGSLVLILAMYAVVDKTVRKTRSEEHTSE